MNARATASESLTILYVDDNRSLLDVIDKELPKFGHRVTTCTDGEQAIRLLRDGSFDVAFLDIRLPGISGLDVLREMRRIAPQTDAVMATALGTTENAITALRYGAVDFFTKPFKLKEVIGVLRRVAERKRACTPTIRRPTLEVGELIGDAPEIVELRNLVTQLAPTPAPVLITGEAGTGKALLAGLLHQSGPRAGGPFVHVRCAHLRSEFVEGELFGLSPGLTNGTQNDRRGLIEAADGGTVFLDEVSELDLPSQGKLFTFLESAEIRRIDETAPRFVDARVICATSQALAALVDDRRFRQELYSRLRMIPLCMPALRDRPADIPILAHYFLDRLRHKYKRPSMQFTDEAIEFLKRQTWPGNVRELRDAIERAVIFLPDDKNVLDHALLRKHEPAGERPLRRHCVFISFSHDDEPFVAELSAKLDEAHITFFKADRDILPASEWAASIWSAVRDCRLFLPILTPRFIRSRWFDLEGGAACASKKKVLPVLRYVDVSDVPVPFNAFQSVVVENSEQLDTLIAKLREICES